MALKEPSLCVMNFLNEVKLNYPTAISFSAGRPADQFFDLPGRLNKLDLYVAHESKRLSQTEAQLLAQLGQYGRTNGILGSHLASMLALDEDIKVNEQDIIVTTGCQEAMALLLIGLFDPKTDVLLSADPTYIGITGLADLLGIEVQGIDCNDQGLDLDMLERSIIEIGERGKIPRAVYVIPDFNNPLGSDMPVESRRALLAIAAAHDLWVFEDNPYGMFRFDGEPAPTLMSMDTEECVIYLGTFSKTLFPSLRVGFLVSNAHISDQEGGQVRLTEALSKVKSLTTVNTSAITQAMIAGVLIDSEYSLRKSISPLVDHYRKNRDTMLSELEAAFPKDDPLAEQVTWNRPHGGFFMTINLPFPFDDQTLADCAAEGVIVVPMAYFAKRPGRERQIRLSFSSVTCEEIKEGIAKLAAFIRKRCLHK